MLWMRPNILIHLAIKHGHSLLQKCRELHMPNAASSPINVALASVGLGYLATTYVTARGAKMRSSKCVDPYLLCRYFLPQFFTCSDLTLAGATILYLMRTTSP